MPRARPTADQVPLTPVVLHILLALTEGARHGYAIARDVETLTGDRLRMGPGTLYGSLQRMLADGLLEPATGVDDDRRRYYRMTRLGRRTLERELERLEHLVAVARRKHVLRVPGTA